MSLKDKLEAEIQEIEEKGGKIVLDSATLTAKATSEADTAEPIEDRTKEDSTVKLSERVKKAADLLESDINLAGTANREILAVEGPEAKINENIFGTDTEADKEQIVITAEDKDAFISSVLNNSRFTREFSLLGGQFSGTFRSRTQAETLAIFRRLDFEFRAGEIQTRLEYATRLRSMILACQVARLNDVEFIPLTAPLHTQLGADAKTTPPGWLEQAAYWDTCSDAIVGVLYAELRLFEQVYMALVDNATNQNFWQAGLSI